MCEYEETTLADVSADIAYGYTESASDEKVGPRFLRITDIQDGVVDWQTVPYCPISESDHQRYRLHPGDIVVARTGNSTGENYLYRGTEDAVYASYLIRFRVNKRVADPAFVWYNMRTRRWKDFINSSKTGSAQAGANAKVLGLYPLNLPPLPEQRAIASILGTLDDKIELNRRMNATLEAMARALFQSWFVDFDPVRAKLDGRQPVGMDAATAELFPDSFEESELGRIPKGWRVGSIYEVSDVVYGAPFASGKFNKSCEGVPLIRIRDLVDESPSVWTTEVHPKGCLVQPGDVVVGMDGEFRAYLWGGVAAWLNQRVCVFSPKTGFSAAYVRNSIMSPLAAVEATETATTVIHLGKNDIDQFKVVIPPSNVHDSFARLCQPWYDEIIANRQQSRTLATLRDTLLPKLLSGEISIPVAK